MINAGLQNELAILVSQAKSLKKPRQRGISLSDNIHLLITLKWTDAYRYCSLVKTEFINTHSSNPDSRHLTNVLNKLEKFNQRTFSIEEWPSVYNIIQKFNYEIQDFENQVRKFSIKSQLKHEMLWREIIRVANTSIEWIGYPENLESFFKAAEIS